MYGCWGPSQGEKKPAINKGEGHLLKIVHWSEEVLTARVPKGLERGRYKVGVYCEGHSSGWIVFKVTGSAEGDWLAYIFALVGLVCLSAATWMFARARSTQQWSTTVGQVLNKEIEEHHNGDGVYYQTVITYRYTVHSKTYTSSRLFIGGTHSGFSRAKLLLEKFRESESLPIYYDPANPEEAVLMTGVHLGIIQLVFIFAVVFGGTGLLILFG